MSDADEAATCIEAARIDRAEGNSFAALAELARALEFCPADIDALLLRAAINRELGRRVEALADCELAVATDTLNWYGHHARGVLLQELDRPEEALNCFEMSLELNPANAALHHGRGEALAVMRRFGEALDAFERALALQPQSTMIHVHRAFVLLTQGRLSEGLAAYEWRRRGDDPLVHHPHFRQRELAAGEDPSGKRLLLYGEQGLGDTIQFARFAESFADRGAIVTLAAYPLLQELLTGLTSRVSILSAGQPIPEFDVTCPLVSAPHKLGMTLESLPSKPYLKVPAVSRHVWRERIAPVRRGLLVGLAWSGHPRSPHDPRRSIPFATFRQILDVPGVTFVSLQKDVRTADEAAFSLANIADFSHWFTDFSELAALISEVDLVIAVDTACAHLAGALGKPVWILLPFASDWRWLVGRADSPWYPTARLFRQAQIGDWEPVLAGVKSRLTVCLASGTRRNGDLS